MSYTHSQGLNNKFMHQFITNQKLLAREANITEQHLTGIKQGTRGIGTDTALKLHQITGIDTLTWISATRKKTLQRAIKRFLEDQCYMQDKLKARRREGKYTFSV